MTFSLSSRVLRLALEILHDVQKLVVDIRLAVELYFDLIKVTQGVLSDVFSMDLRKATAN